VYRPGKGITVKEAVKLADERMYTNKQELKGAYKNA
jgi:hypothetical protein